MQSARSLADLDLAPPLELDRLRDGELLATRFAEPNDAGSIHELAADFVTELRRARRLPWPTRHRLQRQVEELGCPDRVDECVLAIEPRTGSPCGMASLRRIAPDDASAGAWVLVRCSHRRRGVATVLVERLAELARARGYRRLRVRLRPQDDRMLDLMRRIGATCRHDASADEIELETPIDNDGLGIALSTALWAVARGGFQPVVPANPALA